jgi:hypothetical protein
MLVLSFDVASIVEVSKPTDIEGVAVPVSAGLHHPLKPILVLLPSPPLALPVEVEK